MAVEEDRRVSTLELFTDLVFVFAITQLTTLLSEDATGRGVLEVLLIFGVLWWMFGGYVLDASLTSAAVVALSITSAMWWLYFSGDGARARSGALLTG